MKRSNPPAVVALRALRPIELARVTAGHGSGLAGLSLKQHVDNPGQTPMKD